MAAQELRWLTYLLTDLGEAPRSPPVLYVDNKAMLALCQEHKLEHRTKHIALRYFLARELQQRGQLRLAYVASQANTADVFPKAVQPCDHQRFCIVLEAAALGSSESAVAPGAGESAAALCARESAVSLDASVSTATGPASAEALHTFTLDSSASRCIFCDCTTITPLAAPGPVVAQASTVLPCLAVPFGSLSGLHLPAFSTNLLRNAVLQDEGVDTFILGGQHVATCKCSRTGLHLATFTRQPGSSLYALTNTSARVAELGQVAASSWVSAFDKLAASCSCRVLSHQTLVWHHHLGHPSLPHLHSMHSRLLCRIGLIMEVAHTSMLHAAAPHFLWPFAVRYASHQLNLWHPPPSRPAATTATAAAGGGAAGSARSAAGDGGAGGSTGSAGGTVGAGGATGSAGGAAGAEGAGPTTDRHCLSWPLSQQLQRLGVDNGGGGGFGFLRTAERRQQSQQETFSPQVLSELFHQRCVTGSAKAAALGASESAASLGVSESATALGASESAAALGAGESGAAFGARASPATGPPSAEALHTFTLDSGASRCFFRDCTTLTFLEGCMWRSLRAPGLAVTWLRQVAASSQVSASGQLAASCSCQVLSHQTLLWHHRLGHPSPPRLRGMQSRLLVSGLPRSLPSLPRSPAPPCLPCVEGRQRTALHSSEFSPTTAPLQTLHMDVWGLAPVGGMDQERFFLLAVDDYTRYTTAFPLRRKADVSSVLIPWIYATRHQLRERFTGDFLVLHLHSDMGVEFSSDLLAEFC
ncbi:unnamed protein product [Closterium sp. NIES-53]